MSLETNNILYKEKYDGVLYYYQVHALFRWFVRTLGFTSYCDIPLNILMTFQIRKFWLFTVLSLHLYSHRINKNDERNLHTRKVKILLLPSSRQCYETLISSFIQVLLSNLNATNIGLKPVQEEAVRLAREKLFSISHENLLKPASDKLISTYQLPEWDKKRKVIHMNSNTHISA